MNNTLNAIFSGDQCISCTSCMSNCPVMSAFREYNGPKLIGPAHERMHFSQEDVEKKLKFCSNCKSCDRVCPSGVSVSTLNMIQRAKYYKTHKHSPAEKMLAHGERMADLIHRIPFGSSVANLGMKLGKTFGMFELLGITNKRNLPAYASKSFKDSFKKITQKSKNKKVVLFTGCYVNNNEPQVGEALVRVMQTNGYEVLIDEKFNCCGSPLVVTGFLNEAHEHAHNNVDRILDWKKKNIPVITPCTSCSLMFKQEHNELFAEAKMQEAAENVYDVFEFLEILQERGEFNDSLSSINQKLLYHVPCHLKTQAMGLPAVNILNEINGTEVKLADAGCCGISGNYGFYKDRYEISMKIGAKLFERINQKNFDNVISDCGTCRMQIFHGTAIKSYHPIEILARAY